MEENKKWFWISYAVACTAACVAICFGLYYTRSMYCLIFLVCLPKAQCGNKEDEKDGKSSIG